MTEEDQKNSDISKIASLSARKLQNIEHRMADFVKEIQVLLGLSKDARVTKNTRDRAAELTISKKSKKTKASKPPKNTLSLVVNKKGDDDLDKK